MSQPSRRSFFAGVVGALAAAALRPAPSERAGPPDPPAAAPGAERRPTPRVRPAPGSVKRNG